MNGFWFFIAGMAATAMALVIVDCVRLIVAESRSRRMKRFTSARLETVFAQQKAACDEARARMEAYGRQLLAEKIREAGERK